MNPEQLRRFSEAVAQAVRAAQEAAVPPEGGFGAPADREGRSTGGAKDASSPPPPDPATSRKAS